MSKLRKPNTIEDALLEIYSTLGLDVAAATVGKSEQHLRRWSDPDQDSWPNIHQCAMLDAACLRVGGQAAIGEVYARWMKSIVDEIEAADPSLKDMALELSSTVGKIAEELVEATSKQSQGGEDISPAEANRILRNVTMLDRLTDVMGVTLKRKQSPASKLSKATH